MDFGRRLLPQVVDSYANSKPGKYYASVPKSGLDLSQGYQHITMKKLAALVNRVSWWLDDKFGRGHLEAISYIGPADIRYAIIFLAATKCRYKLAGVHAYIDLPIFYEKASVVFGPSNLPPSGYLLAEILKHEHVRAIYAPPSIIEEWYSEPAATEQAKQLDFILYGGGPLSSVGQNLSQVTNVCQMYGSLEVGQWMYMEFNPSEEVDMQHCGDGTFEMVLHQHPKFALHRSLWHNFPEIQEWRTNDLFVPHPTKKGLWRFHGRLDDLIVLSSSYKLRPLEMETIIQGNPSVSGALIAGQGMPEPIVIIEPRPDSHPSPNKKQAFVDKIWPTIVEANKIAPSYAKINRSRILLSDPQTPFIRAPKGTVVRKLTTKAYADAIDAAFNNHHVDPCGDSKTECVTDFILPGLKQFVRSHIADHLQGQGLADNDNIFLCGLDSLGAISLCRSLQRGLTPAANAQKLKPSGGNIISLRLIYRNPTIERLANLILDILANRDVSEPLTRNGVNDMEHVLTELTEGLPAKEAMQTTLPATVAPGERINVALIGPRGSLGPNIVRQLLDDPRVAEIYCLNRGSDGKERLRSAFQELGIADSKKFDTLDQRLFFMPVNLGESRLGLAASHLKKILNDTSVIIHNAWRVDFSWELDTYRETYLRSIREVIELSSLGRLRPRVAFVSSVSSVQEWAAVFPDSRVEEALPKSYQVASPLGYGRSKHVAERMLAKASSVLGIPITILRLGQVAGPTDTSSGGSKWSTDEWIPSLAAISKILRMIPADLPPIDWVPVDLASRALVELALLRDEAGGAAESRAPLRVFNLVNPNLSQWSTFAVPLSTWVDALVRLDPAGMPEAEARSSTKILPFFQLLADTAARGVALQPKFDTANAVRGSKTMRTMIAINEDLVGRWLSQWGI
ncbi:male sterility protein-domain-containing protein [Astrocystis sublimbata]|nr:male sterility protein-domain-containing protein [Astrocystis sublimbata]